MTVLRHVLLLGALLLGALLPNVAGATDYPLTVRDELGREVTLAAPPQRIIAMIPSHTETVCALGACELLVGRDAFSNYPAAVLALPDLGSAFSADLEALLALEPDLVLVDEFSGLADALAPLGVTVYAGTPQTFDEVFAFFGTAGLLLDRETEAALLAGRVRGEIDAIAALVANEPTPSVYYEIDATPYSVGPNSFIGELLSKAGGANIVPAELGDFPQLDPEFIIAADPEVIILADAPFGETPEKVAARPGWAGLQAVRNTRVVPLTAEQADAVSRAGPRMAEAVRILAAILHPELF